MTIHTGAVRSGQSIVSVLVGAGASMALLAGVITMIQYSQKAGQGVQGKSEFGALVDSVRSISSSSDACRSAFVDASGAVLKVPAPSASADSVVEAEAIRVGGVDFVKKGEATGAVSLQAIRLTRPKGTTDLLSVQLVGQKKGEVLGTRDLQNAKPLVLQANFASDGSIESCQAGSGNSGGAVGADVNWEPVSLSDKGMFDSSCEYRFELGYLGSGGFDLPRLATYYASGVSPEYLIYVAHNGWVSHIPHKDRSRYYVNGSVTSELTVVSMSRRCATDAPVVASTCPNGMIAVTNGPASKKFCIDSAPRANAKYPDAVRDCYRQGSELCSAAQWSLACEAHSATNSTFFAASGQPSQPHEWIQSIFSGDSGNGYVAIGGGGNCWNSNPDPFSNLHPYRCCWTPNAWADLSGDPGAAIPRLQTAETMSSAGTTYACNTTYRAASDGFIVGSGRPYWGQDLGLYVGSDQSKVSARDSSTEMGVENGSQGSSCSGAEGSYVMSPVKAGDYWRVSCGNGCLWKVTFVPLR